MSKPALPKSIQDNPWLDRWIAFDPKTRSVTVRSGKVEIGQGAITAIRQMAAHELGLTFDDVTLVAGDTSQTPDEWYTAGSMSVEVGGKAMRMASAQAREMLKAAASKLLSADAAALDVADGVFTVNGKPSNVTYWDAAKDVDFHVQITGEAPLRPVDAKGLIGRSVPRMDLAAKVTGAAFIHDMELPGMVHGRVLRPPSYGATLKAVDTKAVEQRPGVKLVLRNGSFLGLCAETEEGALAALKALDKSAQWDEHETLPESMEVTDWLPTLASEDSTYEIKTSDAPLPDGVKRLSAVYSRPVLAHASIGPACGLAWLRDGHMTVWSHSQGVFQLKPQIAKVLGMDAKDVTVIHAQGAGAYGHNAADDAALDAALLAKAMPGTPVRVQWSREDELTWSPFGAAMMTEVSAALDADGKVTDWQVTVRSGPHSNRPGTGGLPNLAASWHIDPPFPAAKPSDPPMATGGGGARNAEALYDFPRHKIIHQFVPGVPFRQSSLRTLGSYGNVLALECFMDELAEAVGADPVAFRLQYVRDARVRAVIEEAAAMSGWKQGAEPAGTGRAKGFAFSQYKNKAGYAAMVMDVEVDENIAVHKVWCAADVGLAVNPDGAINQIEGGIIQALSWTLKEAVTFDRTRITSRTWEDYPILGFAEVPEIEVKLIGNKPENPPLGVGEVSAGPTAAAVANAASRALGVRLRNLPLTRDRIMAAALA